MPGKHVHFSRTTTIHSPPTPALSNGSLSPASSAAPLTPPSHLPALPGPSPYAFGLPGKVQPTRFSGTPRLHSLLQASHSPAINFDVSQHPSTISTYRHGLHQRVLAEPATSPSLPSMTLFVPYLPWSINVYPSTHGRIVTVGDVLDAIYHDLRVGITFADFNNLPSDEERRRVTRAYERRYRRMRGAREYQDEKRRGVRRVDFLMENTHFSGISPAPQGRDIWILNTT